MNTEEELRQEIRNLVAELNLARAETVLARAEGKKIIAEKDNEIVKLVRQLAELQETAKQAGKK